MRINKLEEYHRTLESLGGNILRNDFDLKTTLTALIVILKEMVEYEIEKQKAPTSPYT